MKKITFFILLLLQFSAQVIVAQGADCANADPFCTGTTYNFPASTGVADGGSFACLGSTPNPAWYYLNVATSGDIVINISQADASGSGLDVDFICYGPYSTLASACTNQTGDCLGPGTNPLSSNTDCSGMVVDCSYSTNATETCGIQGAVAGQWYMLLLTNFSDQPANITFSQGNSGAGAGSTNCAILCNMTGLTATPGACTPATNTYNVTGTITYSDAPTSGTLTVTNSCTGATQVFNAPFPATSQTYTLSGLPANGAACSVTAVFSGDPTCTLTQNFTAPAPCVVNCLVNTITATPTACNSATQQYNVSGSVSFSNPPSTGTLTITSSCGGTPVVLNAPFTSPAAYTINGLAADGANCTITAGFSDSVTCTNTQTYTAPAPCPVVCSISSVTATPSACDPATNNYAVTGSISFVNAPTTGTLTVSSSCGGTNQVFNAPFTSPLAYALNALSSDGAACSLTAVFSADPACTFTQAYTAPASCSLCPVTAGNNGPLCAGQTINLTATTVPGATYSWTGPGGFVSALQNPTITNATPANSGVYTVSVNVAAPPCNSSSSTTVTINANPVVTVNSPITCVGVSTTLTAAGATSYSWSTGSSSNPINVPGTAATYTVIGTTNGCSDTATATVTTTTPPVVNFIADTLSGCNPLLVHFTADTTGNSGATYTWTYGDGSTGSGISPTHLYTTNGCQTVSLTISFGVGCSSSDTIPCMIDVFAQPNADFFYSPTSVDVLDPYVHFTNTSSNSNIWLWNFGDTTSMAQNPDHIFPGIGTYPVTMYATNSDGCIDSVTHNVIINDIQTIYIPNSFSPNGDGVNEVFSIYSHGISTDNFELWIFDRWGNKLFYTQDLYEGWNGSKNNKGEIMQEDVYVYRVNYRDLEGHKKKIIGHVTIVK